MNAIKRLLPKGLASFAGTACCLLPVLLAAGILGGAGWAAFARFLPALALALLATAGLTRWWANRRHHRVGCAGGGGSCDGASMWPSGST